MSMIEPVLLTAARVCTFAGEQLLTNASGFYFARDERLFLVTSRHVMVEPPRVSRRLLCLSQAATGMAA